MNINNPTTFGTPALVYSTSNSSGTGGALRADDTIAIFSATVPTNISTSTVSASTGDNAFGSREDHVHGSTAILAVASAAEMEAGSSNTVVATPGRTQNHPGVAKGYCVVAAAGTLNTGSYNVASVTDVSTGIRDIVWDVDFADALYSAVGSMAANTTANLFMTYATFAVGSVRHSIYNTATTLVDDPSSSVVYGKQ